MLCRDHYPPKGPLPQEDLPDEISGGPSAAPFDARTTYNVEVSVQARLCRASHRALGMPLASKG